MRAIPRHQIETELGDYRRMIASLLGFREPNATRMFEQRFAEFIGCRHAIAVSSGRLALRMVLQTLRIPPESEVILPAYNYFAVVEEFLGQGIRPVFADMGRSDLNLDVDRLEALVTPRTRLLLATHMYGQPCDMSILRSIADRHKLILLEDCAHAFGSRFDGRSVGTFGQAGLFSLSVMKLITTFGGGVITTNDDELAETLRVALARGPSGVSTWQAGRRFLKGMVLDIGTRELPFSLLGWPTFRVAKTLLPDVRQRLMTEIPRRNLSTGNPHSANPRLHDFQSSLGLSQLKKAPYLIEQRRRVTSWLDDDLKKWSVDSAIRSQNHKAQSNGMYFGVLVDDPVKLSQGLFDLGIDSETSEYRNCADLEIYGEFHRDCPVARRAEQRILRIPSHPRLTRNDVQRIAAAIGEHQARGVTQRTGIPRLA